MSGAYLTNTGGASFRNDQGGAGRDYKRVQSDYGRAMRLLRRDSYRNPESALGMINLRDNARERGIAIGGVHSAEDNARNADAYTQNMGRMAADRERESQIALATAEKARGVPLEDAMEDPQGAGMVKKDISGRVISPLRKPETPATGNPTRGVLDQPLAPRLSFAEQEKQKREQLTRSGAFGSGAQARLAQGRRY